MADETNSTNQPQAAKRPRRAASRPAGPPVEAPAADAPAKATRPKKAAKTAKAAPADKPAAPQATAEAPAKKAVKKARGGAKASTAAADKAPVEANGVALAAVFQPPDTPVVPRAKKGAGKAKPTAEEGASENAAESQEGSPRKSNGRNQGNRNRNRQQNAEAADAVEITATSADREDGDRDDNDGDGDSANRRRRRRGGRRRRKPHGEGVDGQETFEDENSDDEESDESNSEDGESQSSSSRRRRKRRRPGSDDISSDDPPNTVVRVRDDSTAVRGSTRLEAKKQRRREGRDAGRRRAPILTEAEFLARRENVNRVMVVRQAQDRVQIAVLEDDVLVEHYVNRHSGSSLMGNVYLGRIQNVLPSMEAAFVDIGRGRNAVLYAGEVNWDAAGLDGQAKRIEMAFKPGDPVLVQVTKDPIGHKGARLTAQISMPGRFLVYVPDGSMTGISRKLPEKERNRLKSILRSVLPEEAGVIVRTAAEGAAEEDLTRDVSRLAAQWQDIAEKAKTANAPALLYSEPDLAIRVVRDIFNEDFNELIVSGNEIWETLEQYVTYVAPDLAPRLHKWVDSQDLFTRYRIDEQLAKALDRKVWLPSGGSLVIDRTEAMTVVDVNTGKFTGEGGNLEQTVTRNNLEAAEEIVRQLRLRDIGGIIVVDFIDMVLESNRDLVLRRLIECLGRDRTKHQVAEVTSLGLVQMTRKRIGQGLLETFSEPCEHCHARGVKVKLDITSAKTANPAEITDHEDH
ncbi:MAG: hypothetical protein RIS75_274 [Actinomycetota bacterium]